MTFCFFEPLPPTAYTILHVAGVEHAEMDTDDEQHSGGPRADEQSRAVTLGDASADLTKEMWRSRSHSAPGLETLL